MKYMMMKNKKGVAPIVVIGIALAIIMLIYLLLYIPIPAFSKLRQGINYYLVLALWVIIQISIVYAFVEIIFYIKNGFKIYKSKLLNFDMNIKELILHR